MIIPRTRMQKPDILSNSSLALSIYIHKFYDFCHNIFQNFLPLLYFKISVMI